MESCDHPYPHRLRKKLHQALSRLQGRDRGARLAPETLKLLRGIVLVMIACTLAWLSVLSARETTIIEYRKSHVPPPAVWRGLLLSKGYQSVSSPSERAHLIEGSSPFLESPSDLQAGPGLTTLIFPRGSLSSVTEVWHREVGFLPGSKTWTRMSSGLEGLEALSKSFETSPQSPRPHPKTKAKFIDPKEIRY